MMSARMTRANKVLLASAGTGKTHQLTNEYIRLLIAGVEPNQILATTFTRKAAAEIADRVLFRLAQAAANDKNAGSLARQIGTPEATREQFAACLVRVLHQLHRIRIGTIDSFNMALAGSFGFELNLPAGWSICEETENDVICREAIETLLDRDPDQIAQLVVLINRGAPGRSIQKDLKNTVDKLYTLFRASEQAAWESLRVPKSPTAKALTEALAELEKLELDTKGATRTKTEDLERFRYEDWDAFLGKGIAAAVVEGRGSFNRKHLSAGVEAAYRPLIQHAKARIIQAFADQCRALWDFLRRFDEEVWSLRRRYGALRFEDVTHTLAAGMRRKMLGGDEWGYRLDGPCTHLLFDEFQDTSVSQWWAVAPLVEGKGRRSFFCVGDKKQAIYRWRGGLPQIFDLVGPSTGSLAQSQRSDRAIIEVVNEVFTNLTRFESKKCQAGLAVWQSAFEPHTTAKPGEGYVCLHSGPAQAEDENIVGQREGHYRYVAEKIREIVDKSPHATVGVLCRTNDTLARMMFDLRQQNVNASEEGGHTLDDSAAVEVILSLLTLADHPRHGVASFHLRNSPLKHHLNASTELLQSAQLRHELFTKGYAVFVRDWARLLAPACDERDQRRLQQLIELAYDYEKRSTLRADDFVNLVRNRLVPDPTDAKVRVMTIHTAKGLQFDVVVLPEVDEILTGINPHCVTRLDPKSLEIKGVCRYVKDEIQALLDPEDRSMFDDDSQRRVEDSLCLLYVAMTRPKHALYIFMPGPRKADKNHRWYKLLLASLQIDSPYHEKSLLRSYGNADWFKDIRAEPATEAPTATPARIAFSGPAASCPRGLQHVAPSRREGDSYVTLKRLFNLAERQQTSLGTLFHAWFAAIEWIDAGLPSAVELRAIAGKLRSQLSSDIWDNLESHIADFHSLFAKPEIARLFRRASYQNVVRVDRERRFVVHEPGEFCSGSADRIVWLGKDATIEHAKVIDFKTDVIESESAIEQRTEHYRPQLEAYRRVVARLGGIPVEKVAAYVVFTGPGRVIDICDKPAPCDRLF